MKNINQIKEQIKLERDCYQKWSAAQRHGMGVVSLIDASYAFKAENGYRLSLPSNCYPRLKKDLECDTWFWGFKCFGLMNDKKSWKSAYRSLRKDLKRIAQQKTALRRGNNETD